MSSKDYRPDEDMEKEDDDFPKKPKKVKKPSPPQEDYDDLDDDSEAWRFVKKLKR